MRWASDQVSVSSSPVRTVSPRAAFGGEESRALGVVFFLVEVLTAIQLDDQFLARGAKVGDVRPNGVLAAEMDSIGALSARICPQFGFGRSLLSTQFARRMHHLRRGAFGFLDELLLPAPSHEQLLLPHFPVLKMGEAGRGQKGRPIYYSKPPCPPISACASAAGTGVFRNGGTIGGLFPLHNLYRGAAVIICAYSGEVVH